MLFKPASIDLVMQANGGLTIDQLRQQRSAQVKQEKERVRNEKRLEIERNLQTIRANRDAFLKSMVGNNIDHLDNRRKKALELHLKRAVKQQQQQTSEDAGSRC